MNPTVSQEPTISFTLREVNEWRGIPSPDVAKSLQLSGPTAAFAVPGIKRSVPVIRHLARLWMDSQNIPDEGARYGVQLALSELTTNAVEHTNSMVITSRLHKDGTNVLVEVQDQGGTPSVPRLKPPDAVLDHGRGLALVAEIVRGWGFRLDSTENSCTVWAVIPYSDTQAEDTQAA
ncbi:ATP-binding protein [Streptomyces sp. 3N207]|uniref:ATP-binding protein n=1 Tax=Streptomyces sp. 3N207 TaxID=3457417 RepID=UPI003FD0FD29